MLSFSKLFLSISLLCISFFLRAQITSYSHTDSLHTTNNYVPLSWKNGLTFSSYFDFFYSYDLGNPTNFIRQPFLYSYNRHNDPNINLALLKLDYKSTNIKANLALMAGTYAVDNLGAEWSILRHIYEANWSIKLSKKKNVWLQMGVFPSHIGFESAIGIQNWNLTRSLLAENSPYFETGINVSYTSKNEKWTIAGFITNGWQRIYRTDKNNLPAIGHQVIFAPSKKYTFTSSSYIGIENKNGIYFMRYFHHFNALFNWHKKVGFLVGFDSGIQQKTIADFSSSYWFAPIIMLQYKPSDKIAFAVRGEYFSDVNNVVIVSSTPFETAGYSLNIDYKILPQLTWRIEGRGFYSLSNSFLFHNQPSHHNWAITTSVSTRF